MVKYFINLIPLSFAWIAFTGTPLVTQNIKIDFKKHNGNQFLALVDAGSSGSRMYVYKFTARPASDSSLIQEITFADTKPGVSSFAAEKDPEQLKAKLKDYFGKLIQDVESKLKDKEPTLTLEKMPLYLLATAGMRNIPSDDQVRIIKAINESLQGDKIKLKAAHVIEGIDEALYAWTGANYNSVATEKDALVKGLVEIGGASAQVVFPTMTTTSKHLFEVMIKKQKHRLYVYSYPKNGSGEIKGRIKKSFEDPNDKEKSERMFNALCGTGGDKTKAKSNFELCVSAIVHELQNDCRKNVVCSVGWAEDADQPKVTQNTPFAYAGVLRQLKSDFIDGKTEKVDMKQSSLKTIGTELCQKSNEEIVKTRAIKKVDFASSGCWQAALAYAFLFGDKLLSTDLSLGESGIGLPPLLPLVYTPDPGPQFPVGFILFHHFRGKAKPYTK